MKVLAIGAHPDDIELSMGGTIVHHVRKGDDVIAAIVSNGEKIGNTLTRVEECKKALKLLGVKEIHFFDLPDTKIKEGPETIQKVENVLALHKIDRVYSHHFLDSHQDHRNTSKAVISACRNINQVLFFETPSSELDFTPNFFIDITPFLDIKIKALKTYQSLLNDKKKNYRYLEIDAIVGGAFFRGYQIGVKYAESFKVFKFLEF
ncbi:PIG-L family deacetylase [Candidatus Woesearchaeota archaeon]|mgnify:CR=1 FL=1|jgi:LmbE family N-acetylglucosaminyl deacetylase|nr:PIG-L family deacetylase [Candidatus Woesearchaeota archaeon]